MVYQSLVIFSLVALVFSSLTLHGMIMGKDSYNLKQRFQEAKILPYDQLATNYKAAQPQ